MTDRELLEAAAKAAGIQHITYINDYDGRHGLMLCNEVGRHGKTWSPLHDDGDALRLAVKLKMLVDCDDDPSHPDRYAATRRAIVRAAASLAKEG